MPRAQRPRVGLRALPAAFPWPPLPSRRRRQGGLISGRRSWRGSPDFPAQRDFGAGALSAARYVLRATLASCRSTGYTICLCRRGTGRDTSWYNDAHRGQAIEGQGVDADRRKRTASVRCRVLKALLEGGEDVVAVYCAPDEPAARPTRWPRRPARRASCCASRTRSRRRRGGRTRRATPGPDGHGVRHAPRPEPVLNTPTHGSIQYHPSLLPRHRGPSAINWAIIQGDPKTGIAIFWPDKGLDTGPVLMLREVEITAGRHARQPVLRKLFPLGVEAMVESVDLVREGRAPKLVQDEAQATYESWCRKADVEIDWSPAGRRRLQPHPRREPAAGRVDDVGSEQVEVLDSEPRRRATRARRRGRSSPSTATGSWWPRAAARSRSGSCALAARRWPPATTRAPRASSPARGSAAASVRPRSRMAAVGVEVEPGVPTRDAPRLVWNRLDFATQSQGSRRNRAPRPHPGLRRF